jgi:hypothetical protein
MTVPFEQLGPGQSGRLVWQIMGKNGPVFSPSGIRYLPASGAELSNLVPSPGLLQAATALAGVNLLISTGTLALAAATLAEVKRMSAKVDGLLAGQVKIEDKLDTVLAQLNRIEIKVAEARLATLVEYAVRSSGVGDAEVTFDAFADLAGDLASFIKDAQIIRGLPSDIRVGSDVRRSLTRIWQLLRGVRLSTAAHFNRTMDNPEMVWTCHQVHDYWTSRDLSQDLTNIQNNIDFIETWDVASCRAHHVLPEGFSFKSSKHHEELNLSLSRMIVKVWRRWGMGEQVALEKLSQFRAEAAQRAGVSLTTGIPDLSPTFSGAYKTMVLSETHRAYFDNPTRIFAIPPAVISASAAMGDQREAFLASYQAWWLYRTDAGLLYRTFRECDGIREGYAKTWPEAIPTIDRKSLGVGSTWELPPPPPVGVDLRGAETVLAD